MLCHSPPSPRLRLCPQSVTRAGRSKALVARPGRGSLGTTCTRSDCSRRADWPPFLAVRANQSPSWTCCCRAGRAVSFPGTLSFRETKAGSVQGLQVGVFWTQGLFLCLLLTFLRGPLGKCVVYFQPGGVVKWGFLQLYLFIYFLNSPSSIVVGCACYLLMHVYKKPHAIFVSDPIRVRPAASSWA